MSSKDGMPSIKPTGKLFVDEHGAHYSVEEVAWAAVKFDPNENVRPVSEFNDDKWGANELVPALRETKGVPTTHPAFHFDTETGELTILRGNRRYLATAILREEDPKERGYQFVLARVYRNLPPEKRAVIKMDHAAHQKKLSRLGLYHSIIECKKLGMSEQKTVALLRGALSDSYQADRNVGKANDDKAVFSQYRGFVRTCRWANDIAIVEEAFIAKLKTGVTGGFPKNDTIEEAHKAFLKDQEENPLLTKDVNLDKAPTLKDVWEKALADEEEIQARGGRNAKGSGPMTAKAITGKALKSRLGKAIQAVIARKAKNGAAWEDIIDPLMFRLEQFATEEDMVRVEQAITGKTGKTERIEAPKAEPVAEVEGSPKKKTTAKAVAKAK